MAKKTHFPPFCKFEPRQLRKKHGDPPLSLQVSGFAVPWSQIHKSYQPVCSIGLEIGPMEHTGW